MEVDNEQSHTQGTAPRRQALNACDACRQRKTKCDEAKPSCGRCLRLRLECYYIETITSKKSLSVIELSETLKRMDEKLDSIKQLVNKNHGPERLPEISHLTSPPFEPHFSHTSPSVFPSTPDDFARIYATSPPFIDRIRTFEELSLSQRHSTAPQHLFFWGCSPLQLGNSESQYPVTLEISRSKFTTSTAGPRHLGSIAPGQPWVTRLSISELTLLARFYFAHFHPSCLILNEEKFYNHDIGQAVSNGFPNDTNACLVLLVCALGSIAAFHTGHEEWAQSGGNEEIYIDHAGIGFFNLARNILNDAQVPDWVSVQCLLLTGLFYSAKLRVYDAWNVINRACCTILILVPLPTHLTKMNKAGNSRSLPMPTFLDCISTRKLLAEFDFPSSGLGSLTSSVPLPVIPHAGINSQYRQYQFFFLALITIRKLLNRIIYHVYHRDPPHDSSRSSSSVLDDQSPGFLSAPISLFVELDRQLEEWRSCLPLGLGFPAYSSQDQPTIENYRTRSTDERLRDQLLSRYLAAKAITYRPFLYRALHSNHVRPISESEKRLAHTSLNAAALATVYSGLHREPLTLLLHPINSLRNLFAAEIQINFVLRGGDSCRFALPLNWEVVKRIRQHVSAITSDLSPTAARDYEFVKMLG